MNAARSALKAPLAGLLLALATACGGEPFPGPELDREFRLQQGYSATLEDEDLTLRFADVMDDSRCPSGAECPSPGEATIAIVAARPGAGSAVLELTRPSPDRYRAFYRDYEIILLGLEPYPSVDHDPAEWEYVATLVVTRR